MSAAFMKIGKRRIHKERSQPQSRGKLGFLEKHKDYVKRAKDFHKKEDRLRSLRESAALKNPDEFYHGMVSSKTVGGIHVAERKMDPKSRTSKALQKFNDQDLAYLLTKTQEERKRILKMRNSMHLLHQGSHLANNHTIFVDSVEKMQQFNSAKHFETPPEMVSQKYFRPRISHLATQPMKIETIDPKDRHASYKELAARLDRIETLEKEIASIQLRKNLMSKGRCRKLPGAVDQFGDEDESVLPTYIWRAERKK